MSKTKARSKKCGLCGIRVARKKRLCTRHYEMLKIYSRENGGRERRTLCDDYDPVLRGERGDGHG
jgi:hypothetical protein